MPSILGPDADKFYKAAAGEALPPTPLAPIDYDVKPLIESIKQFPTLVHKEEPGFANTFQNPNSKNLLWRSSALLPLGVALSGLAALHFTGSPVQYAKSKKKKPGSGKALKHTVKAADWRSALTAAREQLPGLHPIDSAIGALGGAAVGGLYDVLRGNSERLPQNKRWRSTAKRILGGALLGGAGLNLVGDRARRYVTNTLMPFGYDPDRLKNVALSPKQVWGDLQNRLKSWRENKTTLTGKGVNGGADVAPDSLSKLWTAAVLDKPSYSLNDLETVSNIGNSGGSIDARREIMRRTFGVHTNNPAKDWWQRNASGYYSLNEKHPEYLQRLRLLFGPESARQTYQLAELMRDPQKKLTEFNTKLSPYASQAQMFDFFGSGQLNGDQQVPFAQRGPRVDAQVLDRFDLTLNPDEKKQLNMWVKNKLTGRDPAWMKQVARGNFDYNKDTQKNNDQISKTLGARWLWENVLSNELPWISQKFTMLPNPPPLDPNNPGSNYYPWRMQFLREGGLPAGAPLTDDLTLQKWLDDNPLNKKHPLLAALQAAAQASKTEK